MQVTEIQGDPSSGDVTWHFDVYGLTNHALDNWVEGNLDNAAGDPSFITWNNAPGNNTSAYVPLPVNDVILIGSYTVQGLGTTGEINTVSGAALDTFLQGSTSGLATFIIQRRETESAFDNTIYGVTHRVASKENDLSLAPPTLIATVNPSAVPEPTTLSLLGVGCLALFVFRRRNPQAKA
ncbi:MAG: PEP-CTERM sorting domain-containing protein [Planctomycetota bacterium]|nr:PEP-CTERM sorting domain-containing protein [Planctomycetota bacterium]